MRAVPSGSRRGSRSLQNEAQDSMRNSWGRDGFDSEETARQSLDVRSTRTGSTTNYERWTFMAEVASDYQELPIPARTIVTVTWQRPEGMFVWRICLN